MRSRSRGPETDRRTDQDLRSSDVGAAANRARARRHCATRAAARDARAVSRGNARGSYYAAGRERVARDRLWRRRASVWQASIIQTSVDRLRAVRGRRRQGAERRSSARAHQHPAPRRRRPPATALAAATLARSRFILFPDPGPRSGTTSAGSFPRQRWPSWSASCAPAPSCASPPISASMHAGSCWPCGQQRGFHWTTVGPQDWRERAADWPPTRYERRPSC